MFATLGQIRMYSDHLKENILLLVTGKRTALLKAAAHRMHHGRTAQKNGKCSDVTCSDQNSSEQTRQNRNTGKGNFIKMLQQDT